MYSNNWNIVYNTVFNNRTLASWPCQQAKRRESSGLPVFQVFPAEISSCCNWTYYYGTLHHKPVNINIINYQYTIYIHMWKQ